MEILDTFRASKDVGLIFFGLLFGVISIASLCTGICAIIDKFNDWYKHFIAFVISTAFAILCFVGYSIEPKTRIHALIHNDFPAIELYENYKVIEHSGQLWTLEPIEQ